MNRRANIVGSMAAAISVLPAGPARAEPAAAQPLVIEIRDYASLPRMSAVAAVERLHAIFSAAGIPIRAVVAPGAGPAFGDYGSTVGVTLIVHAAVRDARMERDDRLLGYAPGAAAGGRIAYVFASRVEVVARRHGVDYGRLLGVVLAHEAGHVLMGGGPHASAGVMRAVCGGARLTNVNLDTLTFTREERAILQEALGRSSGAPRPTQ